MGDLPLINNNIACGGVEWRGESRKIAHGIDSPSTIVVVEWAAPKAFAALSTATAKTKWPSRARYVNGGGWRPTNTHTPIRIAASWITVPIAWINLVWEHDMVMRLDNEKCCQYKVKLLMLIMPSNSQESRLTIVLARPCRWNNDCNTNTLSYLLNLGLGYINYSFNSTIIFLRFRHLFGSGKVELPLSSWILSLPTPLVPFIACHLSLSLSFSLSHLKLASKF